MYAVLFRRQNKLGYQLHEVYKTKEDAEEGVRYIEALKVKDVIITHWPTLV